MTLTYKLFLIESAIYKRLPLSARGQRPPMCVVFDAPFHPGRGRVFCMTGPQRMHGEARCSGGSNDVGRYARRFSGALGSPPKGNFLTYSRKLWYLLADDHS